MTCVTQLSRVELLVAHYGDSYADHDREILHSGLCGGARALPYDSRMTPVQLPYDHVRSRTTALFEESSKSIDQSIS